MKDFITENFNWSIDGLRKCIADNNLDAKIIAINGSKAIVKVNNYEASVCLGSYSDWCISQHKCSWEQYVSKHPNNIQLFFFDFSLNHKKCLSLVGATFKMDKSLESMKLTCCFSRENRPIGEKIGKGPESDLEALNKLIAIPNFDLEITPNNNPLFDALVKDVTESNIFNISEKSWGNLKAHVEHPIKHVYDWGDFWDNDEWFADTWLTR